MIAAERLTNRPIPQLNKNIINFINNIKEESNPKAELLQYDIFHDRKEKDTKFIAKQLETHLKERFNVLVSTVEYGIENKHLVRQGTKEPFIESVKKGRDLIQKLSPNNIDTERENAEVVGFEKIDSFLSDPATPVESKMLSISPKGEEGSKYQHNFYDIFTLKEKNGQRYVELSRFSSALSRSDYAKRLGLDEKNPPEAKDFLANPISPPKILSVGEIHKLLHVEHDYVSTFDFDNKIWSSPLVQFFVQRYAENKDAGSFNAILNAADEVWLGRGNNKEDKYNFLAKNTISYGDIRYFETKQVRQVSGQCPGKSGTDLNEIYSVSDFASLTPDKYGKRTFECPKCGRINVRPENQLVANCQHCGSDEVSCKKH